MHVTFLVPHFRPSGGIRHILEMALGLLSHGWEVSVRCVGQPSRFMEEADLRPERLADWWPKYASAALRYEVGSLRVYRPAPGHVTVTYGDVENELFAGRHLRDGVNILLVLDWLAFDPRRQLSYLRQGTWDAVLCSTPFLREKLSEEGLSAWVVGAGIDRRQFYAVPAERESGIVLGSQHSDIPNKGWPDVLSIAARLRETTGRAVSVLSYGPSPGPDPEKVPAGVKLRHVLDPGPDALREVYSSVDAWLCTSTSEGYGFPSLEAMACGVPVVTYENGGHTAYLRDGVNGYSVPVGDVRGAAERVSRLLSPEVSTRLSAGAAETARELSWEACAQHVDTALRTVLRSRGVKA